MQIHPDSPNFFQSSEEIAARKIQAGFRGYRVRKQLKSKKNTKNSHINNNNNNNNNRNSSFNINNNNNNFKLNKKMNGNISKETGTATRKVTMDTFQSDNNDHQYNNHNELSSETSSLPITGPAASSVEDKCATKIQAGIRGYLVRKRQKREQEAATKIQANFRGFKARKELQKNQKIK